MAAVIMYKPSMIQVYQTDQISIQKYMDHSNTNLKYLQQTPEQTYNAASMNVLSLTTITKKTYPNVDDHYVATDLLQHLH